MINFYVLTLIMYTDLVGIIKIWDLEKFVVKKSENKWKNVIFSLRRTYKVKHFKVLSIFKKNTYCIE